MIYPKKGMVQLEGDSGPAQAKLKGQERIYSREDTREIIAMARQAKSNSDLAELGEFVYRATNIQDSRKPQFD